MYDAGNIAPDDEDIVYEYNSDNTLKRILQKYEKDGEIKYRRLVRSAYDLRGNVTAIKTKNGYYQNVTYDAKNRLKKAEGDYSEYWYDADDNRIDMYDHSTNMKYTYDCAGGRSRLVWTSSHLYEVTTYAYGAEGLIWSRTDGSYQVYHYDYRGSVIAVTDIDGNITDTITYTAYGKQASRTGTSKLIFGYNGRHGVLSDPNGLLYMRTRFYNPDFKRFMSADIIDGSIADSTSLNVYAFVNGNPISLIDPFGLSSRGGEEKNTTETNNDTGNTTVDWLRKYILNGMVLGGFENLESLIKYLTTIQIGTFNISPLKLADVFEAIMEFAYNSQYDIVGNSISDIRNDQNDSKGPLSKLRYGADTLKNNGCEIIAVYNTLLLLGHKDVSMAKLILQHQLNNADMLLGVFGTSPKSIGKVLDLYDVNYETISSADEMENDGIYIISYWTSSKWSASLHTIALECSGDNCKLYNNPGMVTNEITGEREFPMRRETFGGLMNYDMFYGYYIK